MNRAVIDQTGTDIKIVNQSVGETVTVNASQNGLYLRNIATHLGITDGTGQYPDSFYFCLSLCPGSGSTTLTQTNTDQFYGGTTTYPLTNSTLQYGCNYIKINGLSPLKDNSMGAVSGASILTVLTVSLTGMGQSISGAQAYLSVSPTTIVDGDVAGKNALTYLAALGLKNRMSLGIVVEGDPLCAHTIKGIEKSLTAGDLIAQVEAQIPGYTGEVRDGNLLIRPKSMHPQTRKALDLPIPTFSTKGSDPQHIDIILWMFIRGVLIPNEGSGFVGGSRNEKTVVSAFSVSNASVESILDLIVKKAQGALWVMREPPRDWLTHPDGIPFDIFGYSDGAPPDLSLACTKPESQLN